MVSYDAYHGMKLIVHLIYFVYNILINIISNGRQEVGIYEYS